MFCMAVVKLLRLGVHTVVWRLNFVPFSKSYGAYTVFKLLRLAGFTQFHTGIVWTQPLNVRISYRNGAKTAWKSYFFPFCSHDAGTKLGATVTFTVTKQCRLLNGMRWNVTLCGIVWTPKTALFDIALVPSFLITFWHQIHAQIQ